MNPFTKNPFVNNNKTKIIGNNIQFDEKQKIENIRENMNKLKYNTKETQVPIEDKQINVKDRIDNLKNLERWK